MNVLLWVAQIALSLLCLAGGAYKLFKFDDVAAAPFYGVLPPFGWRSLGAFEMVCGVLLIVPAAMKWAPAVTPIAAAALALEALLLAALYARYSTQMTAANPLVWSIAMAAVALFVAYGRYALRP